MLRKQQEVTAGRPPRLRKWVPAAPGDPVAAIAYDSLRDRLRAVRGYLKLAAKHHEDDPEYVHQLRICCRRSQAAVQLYRDLMPQRRPR